MKMEDIKTIVQLMSQHDLTEFTVEAEEMHLKICRASSRDQSVAPAVIHTVPSGTPVTPQTPLPPDSQSGTSSQEARNASKEETGPENRETINAPIVGTFYRAPAPDAEPFVKIGSQVEPDTVVCIIEAMKVMNEIKAEMRGVVRKILVENATPVEYGQALFKIEPL